jgi:putative ABC transport system permease protein
MRALDRKLLRDFWRLRAQGLAIALVIACGVATVVMSFGTMVSLDETRASYYERHRFAHVFAAVKRAPESLVARLRAIQGVRWVETRVVKDVTLDVAGMAEPAAGRLVSLPERGRPLLNDVSLRRGRYLAPGSPGEVLVSEAFADAHGLRPGDRLGATINGRRRDLRIVGVVLSPEFIYSISPGVIIPDDRRFGVLWMGRQALAAAFDLEGAFNDVSLSLLRSASAPEAIARLDALLAPYGGVGAYDRDDQPSHAYLSNEMDQLRGMGRIVPPIFLAVAAFLLNTVMSRLIDTEREQIGLLKAFGYGDLAVGWHYLKLALAVALAGVALGFVGGAWLGRELTELYTQFFRFPVLHFRLDPGIFAAAGLVSLAAAVLGTLGAVRRAVALAPAVAMLPAPPARYRPSFVERLGLGRLMGEPTRMILRQIGRFPARAALTTLGIAFSVAILVGSLFFYDAMDHMVAIYFHQAQRQDVTVTLVEPRRQSVIHEIAAMPGVLAIEPYRSVPVRLRFGHLSRRLGIEGLEPEPDLRRMLDTRLRPATLPAEGLVLSTKLAELLGAGRGDRVVVEVLEGRRQVREIAVADVVEEYIGTPAYMDRRALNRLLGEGPMVSGAHLLVDQAQATILYRRLKDTPAVAGVVLQSAALETFHETLAETMDIMVVFYILFSSLISVGVVYNSARIALSERARELASLRVLGFTRFEVSYILLGELTVLTALALPLGCLLGYGLAALMAWSFDTELYRIPLVIQPDTYGIASLVVVAAAAASGLIVRRRIDRLDLVAVLKTRE